MSHGEPDLTAGQAASLDHFAGAMDFECQDKPEFGAPLSSVTGGYATWLEAAVRAGHVPFPLELEVALEALGVGWADVEANPWMAQQVLLVALKAVSVALRCLDPVGASTRSATAGDAGDMDGRQPMRERPARTERVTAAEGASASGPEPGAWPPCREPSAGAAGAAGSSSALRFGGLKVVFFDHISVLRAGSDEPETTVVSLNLPALYDGEDEPTWTAEDAAAAMWDVCSAASQLGTMALGRCWTVVAEGAADPVNCHSGSAPAQLVAALEAAWCRRRAAQAQHSCCEPVEYQHRAASRDDHAERTNAGGLQ